MTPREIVLEQIRHHETTPVPYTLGFEQVVGERLDEHYGGKEWRRRIVRYTMTCGGFDRRQAKPIDDTHERDVFGSVYQTDGRPWHLVEPAIKEPTFDEYEFPPIDAFMVPDLEDKAREAIAKNPDRFRLISMGWGLWEISWALRGFENAMMDSIAEPKFFAELLDRLTEVYLAQVAACADIDADAIMFGDDWGNQRGVMTGPGRWREFMKPRYARIYEAVHAQGKLTVSHSCGSVADIMPDIIEIGLDVLESCQPEARGMNPYELKREFGRDITFWGCLGSQSTIPFGTPEDIHAEVKRLRLEMGKGGGFILTSAKPLQPETPTENAVAVVDAFATE